MGKNSTAFSGRLWKKTVEPKLLGYSKQQPKYRHKGQGTETSGMLSIVTSHDAHSGVLYIVTVEIILVCYVR